MPITERPWNHNTRYYRTVLQLVPARCDRALDIGCGDGIFARSLASKSKAVIALDADLAQVELARRTCSDRENVSVLHGDFLSTDLGHEAFDAAIAMASLHHLPFAPALQRMRALLRPGGRLIVLGVWTDDATFRDSALNHVASQVNWLYQRLWGEDRMDAPATIPEMTLADVRRQVTGVLPGASVRRLLLWRYVLAWQKPMS
jgi:SAM-dependent methyltransferase